MSVDIWGEAVTLRAGDGTRRVVPLAELKEEVAAEGPELTRKQDD
jgi:hypothetical protein